MVEISNVKVYDFKESVIACRNALRLVPTDYSEEDFEKSLERAKKLCKTPHNSGNSNFLKGIRVSFDIKYPEYISPEMQRYHFFDIVTSSSRMHTLVKFAGNPERYNKYVTPQTLEQMKRLQDSYNEAVETGSPEDQYEAFMTLLSNCPCGVELFMRVSTNYAQLKTIYHQRKNHKLKEDWGAICDMIRNLPYGKEFITGEE